jgi:ferredoxin-NADP reductase
MGSLLVIGGTSYFRHKIPYELFYAIHHLVFIMYFVTIAHTLDIEQRTGRKNRSQTFMWFSSTLAFYLCDRAAMYINHWYDTKLQGASVVTGSNGSKTILLRVKRPTLLRFRPGQYVFLRVSKIDNQWHPFSIASCPDSSELEFYIEVYGVKSWTATLCSFLELNTGSSLRVEVMGPYGTSLAKSGSYSRVLAVGAGTGIVPVLSLFKTHIRDLLQLDPHRFFAEMKSRERNVRMMEIAEDQVKGSMMSKTAYGCQRDNADQPRASRNDRLSASIRESVDRHDQLIDVVEMRNNMKTMKKAAAEATRSIWGVFFVSSLPVMGITLFGLTVSWNTIPIDLYPGMVDILKVFTIVFQTLFAVVALFVWDLKGLLAFIDVALVGVSPFADYHFFRICNEYGTLRPIDIFIYSLLTLYMTGRLWEKTVSPRHSTWQRVSHSGSASKVEKLALVWTTPCASQVSALLPSISTQWDILVSTWGLGNAMEVCR